MKTCRELGKPRNPRDYEVPPEARREVWGEFPLRASRREAD